MKILVDNDWVLELFVYRQQYIEQAEKLLKLLQDKPQVEVYATELCLDKIRSFVGHNDSQLGYDAVSWVKQKFNNRLLPFDIDIRDNASSLSIKDFESAVEVAIAQKNNIAAIITLNPEIFAGANLPVLSENNLIERLTLEEAWSNHSSLSLLKGNLQTIKCLNRLLKVEYLAVDNFITSEKLSKVKIKVKFDCRILDEELTCEEFSCTSEHLMLFNQISQKNVSEFLSKIENISDKNQCRYICNCNNKKINIEIISIKDIINIQEFAIINRQISFILERFKKHSLVIYNEEI
ncbi:MAG: hypothetical protein AAGE84_06990 [Cyanobacteria bacterium P01_G01_bin.39]